MSQSLRRGLALLNALADGARTLDQLAETVGVHKSTAMRLLRSLEDEGFVHRPDSHRYKLGSALFDLANRALDDVEVREVAREHLRELGNRTGHTVHLAVRERDQVVYVDKVDSTRPVRMYSRIGARAPLHCTAVGKILMAGVPEESRREFVTALDRPALTAHTLTDERTLLEEVRRAADENCALDRGEHEEFVHCLASGVRDARGTIVAAVSLSAPKVLLDFDELLGWRDEVTATCERISAELGWWKD
ncbi:IclR family transcriptional regulator [Actinopolyspora mortivallis]|uniref:IclR family transcriptional regulator n=1 Tax=Actinopolyspora mortivallis TaxID=33906 RepID=UPI00036DD16B|nr:IclR family transcriptional regulator [Actinopolyspora mortivallis]